MYGLPIATERKKQLPKKAIYAKFDLTTAQREGFDADVARIDIVAVVSPVTIPALSEGVEVKEFYVLDVQMKHKAYDARNILLLTRLIAQNMVFALRYEGQVQFAIFHTRLFTTAWQPRASHLAAIRAEPRCRLGEYRESNWPYRGDRWPDLDRADSR